MLEFLKRRLKSEKGAMDKILVTLLLVVIGIGAVVGISTWVNAEKDNLVSDANTSLQGIRTEN
ncbi:MAG: hypothetical protein U9Q33_07400 [Campylobacterota bacterium]|nr:hypothetical protein [Campylobacterota bacterium]